LGLASNIKHYRLKAGYTQEQLAEKVGIWFKTFEPH
jgi:transcriptional regulator with XRE-family HTH domain